MVKEEMYANGIEIAVLHYPSKRSFAIGCCLQKAIDSEKEIAPELNRLEQERDSRKNGAVIRAEYEALRRSDLYLPKPKLLTLSSRVFKPYA